MTYQGIDYIKKTPLENVEMLFDNICIELIKNNEFLFNKAKEITKKHIEIMITATKETDKKRELLLKLEPTWQAMLNELDNIKQLEV